MNKGIKQSTAGILLLIALSISGCTTLKQMAPNSWNMTVPTGFEGKPMQGVWFGVSGSLPWGKQ